MKTTPIDNPLKSLRFGVVELASAFEIDPRTLARRLEAAGFDGPSWSVVEAHLSLAGDGSLEQLRASRVALQDAQRALAEQQLAERAGRLADVGVLKTLSMSMGAGMVGAIESSPLPNDTKDTLRNLLAGFTRAIGPDPTATP